MADALSARAARPRRAASSLAELDQQMDAAVTEIEQADRKVLLDRWAEYFGGPAPIRIRDDLLRRASAHEAQMRLSGASARVISRRVRKLVAAGPAKRQAVASTKLSPGVRLVREWSGEVHQVAVLDQGFEYRGSTYKSLSEIARLITGTRWSGPLFFGLKETRDGG